MTRPRIPRIKPLLALRLRAFLMLSFVLLLVTTTIATAFYFKHSIDQAQVEASGLRLEIAAISHENQLLEEQVESLLTAYDLQSVELSETVEALGRTEADLTEALRDLTAARSSRGVPRNDVTDAIRRICAEDEYGWGDEANTSAAIKLCGAESTFRVGVPNATGSSAMGLYQLLASNRAKYGVVNGNMESEIRGGLDYIRDRYGTPVKAWAFWQVNKWY